MYPHVISQSQQVIFKKIKHTSTVKLSLVSKRRHADDADVLSYKNNDGFLHRLFTDLDFDEPQYASADMYYANGQQTLGLLLLHLLASQRCENIHR